MLDISVVVPARNRARTLAYCLDSILGQTLPPAEVLVVDDGSTDDTAAVLAAYAGRGVRHLPLPQGRGAQAARNWGIRAAACDWIAFQDSDDLWVPDKLERQVAAVHAAGGGPDLVVHGNGWKRQQGTGETTPFDVPETAGRCHDTLLRRPGPLFPTLLTSRLALERCGLLDEQCPSYQEWDTAIRLSRDCSFIHLQVPLFIWIWHAGETISKDAGRAVRGYNYILDRYRDEIVRVHGLRHWRRQKLAQAALALRAGLWDEARAQLDGAGTHPGVALARLLARLHVAPRGVGRLLQLAGL